VFAGIGFKAYRFHCGEFIDGCEDGICSVLGEVLGNGTGKRTCLGSRKLDLWRFGGKSDRILVMFGRAMRSLLPLTLRAVVRDIARDPVQQRTWGFGGIAYR
jgi:hypothetical protein